MKLFCSVSIPMPIYSMASRLRNRISPTFVKVSSVPVRTARSIRTSIRSFHMNHTSVSECVDRHLPKPAALGTSAMLGQARARVASKVEHACMGERVRFRQQMSMIHQNWEQRNFLAHSPNPFA